MRQTDDRFQHKITSQREIWAILHQNYISCKMRKFSKMPEKALNAKKEKIFFYPFLRQ